MQDPYEAVVDKLTDALLAAQGALMAVDVWLACEKPPESEVRMQIAGALREIEEALS